MSLTISLILTFVCPVLLLGIERLQAEKGAAVDHAELLD